MPGRFEYHPEARIELGAEFEWYAQVSLGVAEGFLNQVAHAIDQVIRFPLSGRQYLAGTRRIVVRGFPYLVVYRNRANLIEVIAVAHTSRRPGYWRHRL